jgi:ferrous iron transport protein B
VDALLDVIVSTAEGKERAHPVPVRYGQEIEEELDRITPHVPDDVKAPKRWVALKLLEDDDEVRKSLAVATELLERVAKSRTHLATVFGDQPEIVIADRRYGFISGACQEAVRSTVETRHTMSDKIDVVMTSRLLGLPIFLAMMYLVFKLTFTAGKPLVEWIDLGFSGLADLLTGVMAEGLLRSLLVDGVIGGVGGVLSLLPNIMLLFLAIAVLEDSGYMARAAFIMDHLMHKIGLHGKSFIPMLIGFGCTVPAIMATRTLETRRDRFITILISPLMSCSARMPVYVLLTGAFFPAHRHWVTFSIYLLGIVLAVIMGKVFGRWLLPGESTPFVMELPPYRIPTLKGLGIHMWERGRLYVKKAGTVILAFSLLIWALSIFPLQRDLEVSYAAKIQVAGDAETVRQLQYELSERKMASSYAGRIGRSVVPALRPIGLGNWRIGTALFAGFGAKEAVVSTMGTLYSLGEVDADDAQAQHALQQALVADASFTPLVAYTFMVFVLIYIPCVAVVAVVKRETNSWRWPLFMIGYTTTLAWVISGGVYWSGRLLGLGLG